MYQEVNTGNNLPGADRDLRHRRRRLQVPLHGQGRRLGEQELPLPGDEGAAEPRRACSPSSTPRSARSARRPARRTTWRSSSAARPPSTTLKTAKLASARYLDTLPTDGQRARARLPRPRAGAEGARDRAADGHRRAVRRQVFLPRRARDPPAAPRRVAARSAIAVSCSADRQALGKITREGVFLEQLEHDPAHYLPETDRRADLGGEVVRDRSATARWPRSAPSSRATRSRRASR